jgi:phospholipid transport system transporter-binding protein
MKAAKRKRAAAAPARTASAVTSDVAEQAAPSVATEQALPAVPVIIEDAAAEAVLVAQMPAANLEVAAAPASQPVVTLDSNCTVKDAAALKQALCAVLDNEATVVIDVGAVDRIDTAAIQLLCAFVRQRAADAHGVAWRGTPSALREAAGLLGVRELLMLPADGGAAP